MAVLLGGWLTQPAMARADPVAGAVVVPVVSTPPIVDCNLDEDAWTHAAVLDGFHQTHPGENAKPSHPTEVRLALTLESLYVAVRAEEEPGHVRATLARRDAIDADDSVSLYLDTFHDQRRAYLVMVNPRGVQQDGVFVEGSEPDFSVDLRLQSAGCLNEDGYAIEVAIPFESLRYQAGSGRTWGLHVLRQRRHAGEEDSWMPLRRDRVGVDPAGTRELRARFLAQAGSLTGLDRLRHTPVLEWIPVATGARSVDRRADVGLGLTARLTVSPALGIDIAGNPDFAEVEADQPQVTANQRFPLFFAEKRPFFLEGADLFRTPVSAFHSRSIVDPDGAVKITGTRGRASGTLLFAADAAPGHFSAEERQAPSNAPLADRRAYAGVFRLRRDVGDQSSLGVLGTSWRFADHSSYVGGLDGRLALGARTIWTFQALGTTSRLPAIDAATGERRVRARSGVAYFSEWARSGRRLSVQVVGEGYSPGYRAALGYTQRVDTNRWSVLARYNGMPAAGGRLVSWSALETTLAQFDWRGRMQYAYTYPRLLFAFKGQGFLHLSAYQDYQRVFEEEFGATRTPTRPGAFAGPSAERSSFYHGFSIEVGASPNQHLSFSAAYDRSWNNLDLDLGAGRRFPRVSPGALADPSAPLDPGPGEAGSASITMVLQPSEALRLSGSYEQSRLTRYDTGRLAYDQRLASLRVQHAFSRFASLRGRLDYDSLDQRLFQQVVFGWSPRPGTAVYLGYDATGEWNSVRPELGAVSRYTQRSSTLFAKVSWAFRTRLSNAPDAMARAGP